MQPTHEAHSLADRTGLHETWRPSRCARRFAVFQLGPLAHRLTTMSRACRSRGPTSGRHLCCPVVTSGVSGATGPIGTNVPLAAVRGYD